MKKDYKNILVIKMSALGDIIHALPSLYELRKLYPDANISWLVEPQFADILLGKPFIDKKIIFYKNDLKKKSFCKKIAYLKNLRKELHSYNFDLVIDLQGLFKSTLVALLSGCSNRIGYWEMREGSFLFTKGIKGSHANDHVVQRYLDVMRYLGANVNEVKFPLPSFLEEEEKIKHLLYENNVKGKYVVFFPGSRWETKEWPVQKYASLAEIFATKNIKVVLSGAQSEYKKAEDIIKYAKTNNIINFAGKTTVTEIIGLVKGALVCIGGDTGPLHIAAAANKPTVSLFGPVSGERTAAYGKLSTIITTSAYCAPCFKRKCPKTFICMDLISVEEVFSACEKSL